MVLASKGRNNFLALPLAFEWSRAYFETGRAQRLDGHIGPAVATHVFPLFSPAYCDPERSSTDQPVHSFASKPSFFSEGNHLVSHAPCVRSPLSLLLAAGSNACRALSLTESDSLSVVPCFAICTDHNRTNDNIDITDASNIIHTSNGYNAFDSNAEISQRNNTSGDQRLQDTPPERATEGKRQTYGEGLPWPSEIITNGNNW